MRTEAREWRQSQILKRLLELVEKESPVHFTPAQLLEQTQGFGVVSKRDLALCLKKFGLHTKNLFIEGHYNRYYILMHSELVQVQKYLTTQTTLQR